jgi:hypothetical protein
LKREVRRRQILEDAVLVGEFEVVFVGGEERDAGFEGFGDEAGAEGLGQEDDGAVLVRDWAVV